MPTKTKNKLSTPKYICLLLLLVLSACQNEQPTTKPSTKPTTTKSKPIEVLPQTLFNESQMTPAVIDLSTQFKARKGKDRKHIFEQLAPLLPNCPTTLNAGNESQFDFDQAQQQMTADDLINLLGEPDEITDQAIAYDLVEGGGYQVIFYNNELGLVACRSIQANS